MAAPDWQDLAPGKAWKTRGVGVQVGVWQVGKALPRLQVTIDGATLSRLGDPETVKFTVQLGTSSEVRELLTLRPEPSGKFQFGRLSAGHHGMSNVYRLLLPPNQRWPLVGLPLQGVHYKIENGVCTVQLPAWAWDKTHRAEAETRRQRVLRERQGRTS